MSYNLFQVNAFTEQAFGGNPAAVCLLEQEADPAWMQLFAAEMNLSETAFVAPATAGFSLRWFTPLAEVRLCGHATLAAAHVLFEQHIAPASQPIRFHTLSGVLTASCNGDWIELNFPAKPVSFCETPPSLLKALGLHNALCSRNDMDYLLEVDSVETVRRLQPDFTALRQISHVRGIIVTSRSDSTTEHFISRFFAPAVGVDEDPVTGSAHCALAPYWAHKLQRTEMTGFQASKRGGYVKVRLEKDRVILAGKTVSIFNAVRSPRCAQR